MSPRKNLFLLLLSLWTLLVLCFCFTPGFESTEHPTEFIMKEDFNERPLEKLTFWIALQNFFFPKTCSLHDESVGTTCNKLRKLNESQCLQFKCCYSPFATGDVSCFIPLKDKSTQMFRILAFTLFSIIILTCLPTYCCSLCQRSKWINSLRRKGIRIIKDFKRQRNKSRRYAAILKKEMQDEEAVGSVQEEEAKAFIYP